MGYSILMPPEDTFYCAITKRPDNMKYPARPTRGTTVEGSYKTVLDFHMSKLVNPKGGQVSDVILNSVSYLIVTERLKQVLEKFASGQIEFLPFRLMNHKGRDSKQHVYVVNVIGTIDCGDPSRSVGDTSAFVYPELKDKLNGAFFNCEKLTIFEERVPKDATIFRVKLFPSLVFVRDDIRAEIEAQKMIVHFAKPGDPL